MQPCPTSTRRQARPDRTSMTASTTSRSRQPTAGQVRQVALEAASSVVTLLASLLPGASMTQPIMDCTGISRETKPFPGEVYLCRDNSIQDIVRTNFEKWHSFSDFIIFVSIYLQLPLPDQSWLPSRQWRRLAAARRQQLPPRRCQPNPLLLPPPTWPPFPTRTLFWGITATTFPLRQRPTIRQHHRLFPRRPYPQLPQRLRQPRQLGPFPMRTAHWMLLRGSY